MEHKMIDEIECRSEVLNLRSKIDNLEKSFKHDHERLEEDHDRLERALENIRVHNEKQDDRAQRMKDKMKELEIRTTTCLDALNDNTNERKLLNEKLTSFANDVTLIKRDMERMADTKKHTFQHIMSIVGPVITAALILWLGLS